MDAGRSAASSRLPSQRPANPIPIPEEAARRGAYAAGAASSSRAKWAPAGRWAAHARPPDRRQHAMLLPPPDQSAAHTRTPFLASSSRHQRGVRTALDPAFTEARREALARARVFGEVGRDGDDAAERADGGARRGRQAACGSAGRRRY
jgi:hypothetical protein